MKNCGTCKYCTEIAHCYGTPTFKCSYQPILPFCIDKFDMPNKYNICKSFNIEKEKEHFYIKNHVGYEIEITDCEAYEEN